MLNLTTLRDIKGNVFVRNADGKEFHKEDPDPYLLQKGDLITILNGEGDGIFVADLGGNGYVLKEGETGLPPRINKIWKQGMDVREILRTNIKVGPTAGETLEILINKLQDEGYEAYLVGGCIRDALCQRGNKQSVKSKDFDVVKVNKETLKLYK